jgi:hypothetical protein
MRKIIFVAITIFIFTSCRKENIIKNHTTNGTVINLATNTGFNNCEVIFTETKKGKIIKTASFYTNLEGKFTFNYDLNQSDDYKYTLSVKNINTQLLYLEGASGEVNKNNLNAEPVIGVYAKMKRLNIISPYPLNNYPIDSFLVIVKNKIALTNLPNIINNYIWNSYQFVSYNQGQVINGSESVQFTSGACGQWNITTKKWKGGIYTVIEDSVFIGWGEEKNYNIPW